ncbi:T9SS type A sorting domain-containing protein, partial [Dyadobacter sp. CY261]|uniref:T9SS type A sorting domain-containing protein n=1 Tax=Dyadobacter sp. CY261 TaxID=2907203 RepID=UPI001F46ED49
AGAGTGNYGFSIVLPSVLKDGKAHQLSVRVKDGGYILGGSPRSVTCSAVSARIAVTEDPLNAEKAQSVEESDLGGGGMVIWPNPTSGRFRISMKKPLGSTDGVAIVDLTGRIVWICKKELANAEVIDVDLSHLGSGTYLVVWQCSNNKEVRRIILVK